jgi:hypothetical protein
VCGDTDETELLKSSHASCRSGVDPEHEESRHDPASQHTHERIDLRDEHALLVCGQSVSNADHCELANSVSDLTTGEVTQAGSGLKSAIVVLCTHVLELDLAVEVDKGGLEQVGRACDERVVLGHKRLDDDAARLAGGLRTLRELLLGRQGVLPAIRSKLALQALRQLGVKFWVLGFVRLHCLVPSSFSLSALVLAVGKVAVGVIGNDKLGLGVETKLFLNVRDLIHTKSGSVSGSCVGFAGRVTNDSADVDTDWFTCQLLCLVESLENGSEIVGTVVDLDDVPALGDELGRSIFSEAVVN